MSPLWIGGKYEGEAGAARFFDWEKLNPGSLTDEIAKHDSFGLLSCQIGAVPAS